MPVVRIAPPVRISAPPAKLKGSERPPGRLFAVVDLKNPDQVKEYMRLAAERNTKLKGKLNSVKGKSRGGTIGR